MKALIKLSVICFIGACCLGHTLAQTQVSFAPANITLQPGATALIAVELSQLPPSGIAAFQFQLLTDSPSVQILDPNASSPELNLPFVPLGNHPSCTSVRGGECADPDWLLTSTQRTPVNGLPDLISYSLQDYIIYGSTGLDAPATTAGAIAYFEVVGISPGQAEISLGDLILADATEPPISHAVMANTLVVTVSASIDSDGDGVEDSLDNCIDVANADQFDSNGDGFGNLCDYDYDNNLITNFLDLNIFVASFGSTVGSPNWNPDVDANNDGVINFIDFAPLSNYFLQPPGPSGTNSVADSTGLQKSGQFNGALSSTVPAMVSKGLTIKAPTSLHAIVGQSLSIDASQSFDLTGRPLTFEWKTVAAPNSATHDDQARRAQFSDTSIAKTTFIAHQPGEHHIEVVVNNGVSSASQLITIVAYHKTMPPNALINGLDDQMLTIPVGMNFELASSRMPDDASVHEQWLIDSKSHAASRGVKLEPSAKGFVLSGKTPGNYLLALSQTNGQGNDLAVAKIQVVSDVEVSYATLNIAFEDDRGYRFIAKSEQIIEHQLWRIISSPLGTAGELPLIESPTDAQAQFFPKVAGQYIVRLDYQVGSQLSHAQLLIDVPPAFTSSGERGVDNE